MKFGEEIKLLLLKKMDPLDIKTDSQKFKSTLFSTDAKKLCCGPRLSRL